MASVRIQVEPPPFSGTPRFTDVRGLYGIVTQHAASGIIANDLDVAKFLIEEAGVAAVPGSAFGASGYLRFSYATSEAIIDEGIASLRAAVDRCGSGKSRPSKLHDSLESV